MYIYIPSVLVGTYILYVIYTKSMVTSQRDIVLMHYVHHVIMNGLQITFF